MYCKQTNIKLFDTESGDQYTFLAMDRQSKLILSYVVGKRTLINSRLLMQDLKARVANRMQLTADAFAGYTGQGGEANKGGAVLETFGEEIDYATEVKTYRQQPEGFRHYSPPQCVGVRRRFRIGKPDPRMICNNHVERTNLSVRLFTRRFTRLTMGFSKTLENHKHAVALFVSFWNFCRVHSAHGKTPAMAAGLSDHVWTVGELLSDLR